MELVTETSGVTAVRCGLKDQGVVQWSTKQIVNLNTVFLFLFPILGGIADSEPRYTNKR